MVHGRPCPPAENHLRRDARLWRARRPDLLRGLPLQPLDRNQRGSLWRPPVDHAIWVFMNEIDGADSRSHRCRSRDGGGSGTELRSIP